MTNLALKVSDFSKGHAFEGLVTLSTRPCIFFFRFAMEPGFMDSVNSSVNTTVRLDLVKARKKNVHV